MNKKKNKSEKQYQNQTLSCTCPQGQIATKKEQFENRKDWKCYGQLNVKDRLNDNKKVVKDRTGAI